MMDDDDASEELTAEEEAAILALLESDTITIDVEEDPPKQPIRYSKHPTPVVPSFSIPARDGPLDRITPFHAPTEETLKEASGELALDLEADHWADLRNIPSPAPLPPLPTFPLTPLPEAPPPPPISSRPPKPKRSETGRYSIVNLEPPPKRKKKRGKR